MARLAYCSECKSISRLNDRKGNDPNIDPEGQEWVRRHWHGGHTNAAFADCPDLPEDWSQSHHVAQFKEALLANNPSNEVYELRDEVKDAALRCFRAHGNPEWPGKPCRDYRTDSKRLGLADTPKAFQKFQCDFCPYNESVNIEKRWRAGQYR